ncbi:MAG: Ig-like domain-containing protein [bacterium]|nr:Ig-like domain-containing protein [bacterium]
MRQILTLLIALVFFNILLPNVVHAADITPPLPPVITSHINGSLLSISTPYLQGTAEALSSVEIFIDGVSAGATPTSVAGTWGFTTPLILEGAHQLSATATDGSSNVSGLSAIINVTVDVTPPAMPAITSPLHLSSTQDKTPTISGTAEAGTTVEVFMNGISRGITATIGTNWNLTTSTLPVAAYLVTARTFDAAGNASGLTAAISLTVYTDSCPTDPAKLAPGFCGCGVVEDTGDSDGDSVINCLDSSPNGGFNISGTVKLLDLDSSPLSGAVVVAGIRSTTSNSSGSFTLNDVPIGSYTVTASAVGYKFYPEVGYSVNVATGPLTLHFTAEPVVPNPAFGFWNGFIGMINILEVMNLNATTAMQVSLTLYSIGGSGSQITQSWTIPPLTQQDIILNDLQGFEKDTYGMLKLAASHDDFAGRVTLYYPDSSASADYHYAFSYSEPLHNFNKGTSAVIYNSYHPGNNPADINNSVYNWLTVANLENSEQGYTIKRYNMTGDLVSQQTITVPPLGRRDVDGGHVVPGPGNVGTNLIIPDNASAHYLAAIVRYAEGSNQNPYDYAFAVPASTGNSSWLYAPFVTDQSDSRTVTENYVEVANLLESDISLDLQFIGNDGAILSQTTVKMPALSQRHFPAPSSTGTRTFGYVKMKSNLPLALVAQSVVYIRNRTQGYIETAYASVAHGVYGFNAYTSFNSFIGLSNEMQLMNVSTSSINATLTLPGKSPTTSPMTSGTNNIISLTPPAVSADSYGIVKLSTNRAGSLGAEVLRKRVLSSGVTEFGISLSAR